MTALQNKALIVALNISQWKGSKVDRKLTKEVEDKYALVKAGRYTKDLITSLELQGISHSAIALRKFHNDNTLPWGKDGGRLLPTTNYFAYCQRVGTLKTEFDNAVSALLENYDTVLQHAEERLKTEFRLQEYPTHAELKSRFGYKFTWLKIADADFRINLPEAELEQLREQAQQEIQQRLQEAQADTWQRLQEHLLLMKAVLDSETRPVFSTLFSHLSDLVTLLPRLNVAEEPALTEICTQLQSLLVEPDAVRKSDTLRAEKAEQVQSILSRFNACFQ